MEATFKGGHDSYRVEEPMMMMTANQTWSSISCPVSHTAKVTGTTMVDVHFLGQLCLRTTDIFTCFIIL
jgi:hypothetical protein